MPTAPSSPSRLRRVLTPRTAHYATLVVALVWILFCARGQWFFYDEWDFLKLSSTDFLTPHLGHWSTAPMLLTAALRQTIGLGSYWPYLVPAILIHLGIAHLLWRIMLRARVTPWIATALGAVVALYGAGAENVLWAFQVGFLGAVLIGLIAVLLADGLSRENYRRRAPGIILLTAVSLTFSGTALPMLAAVGLVVWRRVRFWRAVLILAPSAAVYAVWYAYVKLHPVYFMPPGMRIDSADKVLIDVPAFAVRMLVGGFQGLSPVPFLGWMIFAALILYAAFTARRLWSAMPMIVGLSAAAVLFAIVTAASRIDFSADTSTSGRYIYLTTVLLVPLGGAAFTRLASLRRAAEWVVVASLAALAVSGAHVMLVQGRQQAATELGARDILNASIAIMHDPALRVSDSAYPDPASAPSLTVGDLRALVDGGYLPAGPWTPAAYDLSLARLTGHTAPGVQGSAP
ncbi:hypothetical protein VD659_01320 [Herbiconiux sp. 11R-BC]|uniref:hypothetical protein n=1 Tax=Herbiconiux sp. 11R-BC TaxID=3111637 RepID=UPI003C0F79C8